MCLSCYYRRCYSRQQSVPVTSGGKWCRGSTDRDWQTWTLICVGSHEAAGMSGFNCSVHLSFCKLASFSCIGFSVIIKSPGMPYNVHLRIIRQFVSDCNCACVPCACPGWSKGSCQLCLKECSLQIVCFIVTPLSFSRNFFLVFLTKRLFSTAFLDFLKVSFR